MIRSRVFNGLLVVLCLALAFGVLRAWLPANVLHSRKNGAPHRGAQRPATLPERQAVAKTIRAQLLAFHHDDYARACTYQVQAPERHGPSPEGMRSMITRYYPEFARVKNVQFGEAKADPAQRRVDISVAITGQNGVRTQAVYQMFRDGTQYRIGDVNVTQRVTPPTR